jgi:hypothetical protein
VINLQRNAPLVFSVILDAPARTTPWPMIDHA